MGALSSRANSATRVLMSWLDPPPVVLVSGALDFERHREIQKAVAGAARSGRRVEYIKGSDKQQLTRVLGAGSLFKDKTLVIIHEPEKVDTDLVLKHHKRGSKKICLVLNHEGDVKAKGNLATLAKMLSGDVHIRFKEIPPWKQGQHAVEFVVAEAKRRKIRLSEKLAEVMVKAAGIDLGILAFEIQKLAALLHDRGEQEVQTTHLRLTLSTLSQVGAIAVADALGAKHPSRLVRALATMRRTHSGDPTMKACGLLARNVTQWLHAAALLRQKAEIEEISARVKLHPYVCKTKVVPVAQKWGEKSLARLLTSLGEIERGVKSGHVNSWVELECALLRAIQERAHAVQ